MALTFDSSLTNTLAQQTTKLAFANALQSALTNTRVLRCFRDPNAGVANAFVTGTEFLKVGMTGPLTITAGNITGFGVASGTQIRLAADLSTGTSILRIEGGGHFVQGSLGLTGSGADFIVSANPTATSGIGFTNTAATNSPRFLPTGVGPAALPSGLPLSAPRTIKLTDYTNPASPVTLSSSIVFDTRLDDFVYEDAEMALSQGDVAVFSSSTTIQFGKFEFGAMLFVSNQSNTEVGNVPLYQVLIGATYKDATWVGYPEATNYVRGNITCFPNPFKMQLYDASATPTLLNTFQMHDALPINDPSLYQTVDATHAVRPLWNCAMFLPWQNTRPRVSDKANKLYPGISPDYRRLTAGVEYLSVLSCEPLITGGYSGNSRNGLAHMFQAPKWPQPLANYTPSVVDPLLPDVNSFNGYSGIIEGWGYEPGSYSCHNWFTGPGGPRYDRSCIPSQLATWMTFKTGTRVQESVLWRDLAENFCLAYFNHANHHITDVKTFAVPGTQAEYRAGTWVVAGNYYGDPSFVGRKVIPTNGGQADGVVGKYNDSTGRNAFNGWGRDYLHSYANSGWGALLFNSPMHAVGSKFDTVSQLMLNSVSGSVRSVRGVYMTRQHAWIMLSLAVAWKLGSQHPLGFPKSYIESLAADHLELVYQNVYLPTFVNNAQDLFSIGIRQLGSPVTNPAGPAYDIPAAGTQVYCESGGLGGYMSHALQLWKQTGLWSRMYAMGGHTKIAMDTIIATYDKYILEYIVNTNMTQIVGGGYQYFNYPLPASWAASSSTKDAAAPADFLHDSAGALRKDQDVCYFPLFMWPYVRRDYFPEFSNSLVAQAITKLDNINATKIAQVNAQPATYLGQTRSDFVYMYPSIRPIAPPATGDLGPQ